ncbi:preprotein translocase subunit SecG [Sodalis-like endosymbiont of Proechinophthirus fluctus]|uniref:preprotein translocase subunit SecG n=1 Tax=Sodalis-like endosymbiont of Proechinophthirus fluctus TaxID=1462730 RepID=UPI0007A88BEB|nr:preprotein translocase subunit SecG [Sodalis-like endosymbiont of Proechinophthirus fluctus]KYP97657.1 preprotein translocase subunit SecG [Sodalis-like endosymbiont of Proechinophthirus fluctus]
MYQILLVIFLLVAVSLVALIMLQQGKGADMGVSFGAGASGTLFGSSGSGNFMTCMTAMLAALFFVLSLVLGNLSTIMINKGTQWDNLSQAQQADKALVGAPAKPGNNIPQ